MKFANLHILVLGDVFLDRYEFGECTRISPEAPVPIIQIDHRKTKEMPGGAGNVAVNVLSLGTSCSLGTRMGLDTAGARLNDKLVKPGIFPIFNYPNSYQTPTKTRIVAQNQQVVRIDYEKNEGSDGMDVGRILAHIPYCSALILSDYAKGYFTRQNAQQVIEAAKAHGKLVVVDTKPCNVEFFKGADWFTPNLKEYKEMGNRIPSDKVLITKGAGGMRCINGAQSFEVKAVQREVVDVAGAGDTVVAAFTLALASGMRDQDAVVFANKAAGVAVGKQGTATVSLEEIEAIKTGVY